MNELQTRAADAERGLAAVAREEVRRLAGALKLYSYGRVSLFRIHHDSHFDLIARYSADPSKDHGAGRDAYPLSEGVVAQAWRDQRSFPPSLPSPGQSAGEPDADWVSAQQSEFGVTREEALSLTLRARTYAAVRIDLDGHSLGVLVFEDVRAIDVEGSPPATITEDQIMRHLESATGDRLARLLLACDPIACERWKEYRQAVSSPRRYG